MAAVVAADKKNSPSHPDAPQVFDVTTTDTGDAVANPSHEGHLQRKLQSRHLTMIAIGGAIGTGLFLASGKAVATAGPVGVLISYSICGAAVWGVVVALGEMSTQFPVAGAFSKLATRFLGPAFGFTLGWNYWLQWAITLPAELVACGTIMAFWAPDVPEYVWSIVFLVPLVFMNALGVRGFGELEFGLSLMKVLAIIVFLILAFVVVCGGTSMGTVGFRNWRDYPLIPSDTAGQEGDSQSFRMLMAVLNSFIQAFYSYGGTELVGVTAGEAANPRKSVPRAVRGTFWRITLFYLGALFFIGLIVPYNDERLQVGDTQSSPFTLVYTVAGINVAAHVMNAVVLIAVLSAANSSIYACSRTLMGLAAEGKAPKFLAKVDRRGVPVWSLVVSVIFGCLAFLGSVLGNSTVFNLLSSILALSTISCWMMVNLTHIRFRMAWKAQGRSLDSLIYKAPFHPIGDFLGLLVGTFVISFLLYQACIVPFDAIADAQFYVGIPLLVVLWVGYAAFPFVANLFGANMDTSGAKLVPLLEVDLDSDRSLEVEEDEEDAPPPQGAGPKAVYYAKKAWNSFLG
ncbi:hypothetical protein HDU96_005577 [Phlyctochytrium bullatum]|nr:hypothetical protein HDU96_005577 [Phlyctochytrium bullatum]